MPDQPPKSYRSEAGYVRVPTYGQNRITRMAVFAPAVKYVVEQTISGESSCLIYMGTSTAVVTPADYEQLLVQLSETVSDLEEANEMRRVDIRNRYEKTRRG